MKGIFIDIFPLHYSKKDSGFIYHFRGKLIREIQYIIFKRVFHLDSPSRRNAILEWMLKPLSYRKIAAIRDFLASSCRKGDYYINYGGFYGYVKETEPKEYYKEPVLVDFENRKYYAPRQSRLILSRIYGDYMKLPPIEERRTHAPTKVLFDTRDI